jgi:hypothetical protein
VGHAYLYNNAGVPAVEVSTTAPTNYFAAAYQKTGDASRRYLGSVRTDGSGNILDFQHNAGNRIKYRSNVNNRLVLSAGTATTETNVSCSGLVPVTSRAAIIHAQNVSGNATNMWLGAGSGASDDSLTPPTTGLAVVGTLGGAKDWVDAVPINASQQFSYAFDVAPTSGGRLRLRLRLRLG